MSRDVLTETRWAHAVGLIGKSDIGGNEGSDDEVHMNQTLLLAASAASHHLLKSPRPPPLPCIPFLAY